jgi:predicted DNA-binding protein
MENNKMSIKTFNIRVPKDLWVFMKHLSAQKEKPMNVILVEMIEKAKNKADKKMIAKQLTKDDAMVS